MFPIDNSTAAATLPAPAAAGTPGFFTDGSPGGGVPATVVPADWFNAVQQELINAIETVGLTPSKVTQNQLAQAMKGRLINIQVFDTAGSYTYTPTTGTTSIVVEVQGGGGQGGGSAAPSSGQVSAGGGGAGGAYGLKRIAAGFSGVAVTVGAGGAGAFNAAGNAGGSSSFGSFVTAPGGVGGSLGGSQATTTLNFSGGATGGIAIGGDINQTGGHGRPAFIASSPVSGAGGFSKFGEGGYLTVGFANGNASQSYGSGGSGGSSVSPNGATAGGGGMNGIVIIWEYA